MNYSLMPTNVNKHLDVNKHLAVVTSTLMIKMTTGHPGVVADASCHMDLHAVSVGLSSETSAVVHKCELAEQPSRLPLRKTFS